MRDQPRTYRHRKLTVSAFCQPVNTDVAPPIHVATTFRYDKTPTTSVPSTRSDPKFAPNEYVYSRHTAPDTTRLETILSVLLKIPFLTYSSGLSALHALLTFLNPKNVAIGDDYHGCHGVLDLHKRLTGCVKLPLDCAPADLHEGESD
jgi:cystathionine beta-lyase/cystathionine gamma-synthase